MLKEELINRKEFLGGYVFSDVQDKQKLRNKLESDLEIFLANGGKVNELPCGYTEFKDGKIPTKGSGRPKKEDRVFDPSIKETSSELIEERNRTIRKGKDVGKKVVKVKVEKPKKVKPPKPKKIAKPKPKPKAKEFKPSTLRKMKIAELRLIHKRTGKKSFRFDCIHHGENAEFRFYGKKLSFFCFDCCKERDKEKSLKMVDPERHRRLAVNKENFNKAIASGERFFKGYCKHHDYTDLRMTKNAENGVKGITRYRCCQCEYEIDVKRGRKRKVKQNEES